MKKIMQLGLSLIMIGILSGCSPNYERTNAVDTTTPSNHDSNDKQIETHHILITYFSVPETDGTDTSSSASRVATSHGIVGNTQYVANVIQQEIGGDMFRIETVQAYPETHSQLLDFAAEERSRQARPELKSEIERFEVYDIIFIGYPNWNADLPMPLYTLLEKYDFGGKTIIPFSTHGGSGFARTIGIIRDLQPNATIVSNGLTISRNDVLSSDNQIREWIKDLHIQ